MNSKLTNAERDYLEKIKNLPCGVCGADPISEAHHIEQGLNWCCIPLCVSCHRNSINGIHGEKRMWKVMKKTEMSVLNDTIRAIMSGMG